MIKACVKNQQGSALLMTTLILATLIVVALNAANIVMSGAILSGVQERSTLAFYAAESGAERLLWDARYNDFGPSTDQTNVYGTTTLSNNSYYMVDYATSSTAVTAISHGNFLETERNIEAVY